MWPVNDIHRTEQHSNWNESSQLDSVKVQKHLSDDSEKQRKPRSKVLHKSDTAVILAPDL